MIKLNTSTIKTLRPADTAVKLVFLYNINTVDVKKEPSISHRLYIIEANRLEELNKNIENAKAALDNYSHQHQSILYRLRNFFRHVN